MERTCEQLLTFLDADAGDSDSNRSANLGGLQSSGSKARAEGPGESEVGGEVSTGRRGGPQIRFGPPQIQYLSNSAGIEEEDTFAAPADDFLTLERYMSSASGQEGRRAGPMSADEALAWQLQDRLFLQVTILLVKFIVNGSGHQRWPRSDDALWYLLASACLATPMASVPFVLRPLCEFAALHPRVLAEASLALRAGAAR